MRPVWIFLYWALPASVRPAWLIERVERVVYDGMTRHEWFQAQVREYHETQRRDAKAVETKGGHGT